MHIIVLFIDYILRSYLYECTCVQVYEIPTMETGCEVAKRAFNELTDIQVSACTYVHNGIQTIILCLYY